uniref:Granulins domain-containing protein n=1 Tax=Strigamia maritima TaxID=126957 RepID=T1IZP0_STRMM
MFFTLMTHIFVITITLTPTLTTAGCVEKLNTCTISDGKLCCPPSQCVPLLLGKRAICVSAVSVKPCPEEEACATKGAFAIAGSGPFARSAAHADSSITEIDKITK